ncbi:hypothetical protein Y032_0759g2114 [Ancylostoma ceylanicum]|uniref:Uncharacterized protein n=1 Tax=Ancylostoma ceylanicum TaxID=53326 RepID=A0A016WE18_9BILA|nr:hypothetical protein Y032_0759g2114 [Ancylostoma ceylanicum]
MGDTSSVTQYDKLAARTLGIRLGHGTASREKLWIFCDAISLRFSNGSRILAAIGTISMPFLPKSALELCSRQRTLAIAEIMLHF